MTGVLATCADQVPEQPEHRRQDQHERERRLAPPVGGERERDRGQQAEQRGRAGSRRARTAPKNSIAAQADDHGDQDRSDRRAECEADEREHRDADAGRHRGGHVASSAGAAVGASGDAGGR